MADEVPQDQKNQGQWDVRQKGCGGDADDGITEVLHEAEDAANDGRGKNGFAQLFAYHTGEKEGVHGAHEGIDHSNEQSCDEAENSGKHGEGNEQKQNCRGIGHQDIREDGFETNPGKVVKEHA